jgi:hypothetical protein
MGDLAVALVVAAIAWAAILLAALLPVPAAAFERLRWVGAAAVGLVALALAGVEVPGYVPPAALIGGTSVALAWPAPRRRADA